MWAQGTAVFSGFCATWDIQSHWLDCVKEKLLVVGRVLNFFFPHRIGGKMGPSRKKQLCTFLLLEPLWIIPKGASGWLGEERVLGWR